MGDIWGWLLMRYYHTSCVLYCVNFCALKWHIICDYPANSTCWCVLINPTIDRFLIGFLFIEIILLALILTSILAEVALSWFPAKPLPLQYVHLTLPLQIVLFILSTNTTFLEGLGTSLFTCIDPPPLCSRLLRHPLSVFWTPSVCLGSGWVMGPR